MSENIPNNPCCVVIGASHAGVNLAFSLRKEGWEGQIILIDSDSTIPYHRPPLSKAYLTSDDGIEKNQLKSWESYKQENIDLKLGISVTSIDRENKKITLSDSSEQSYDQLVIATGASPIIPRIEGIEKAKNLFPLRSAKDVSDIKTAFKESEQKRVLIIGGGYIGLETAASLKKMGGMVSVLEREDRVLARVATAPISTFFQSYHKEKGVEIFCEKNVVSIRTDENQNVVTCADGSTFEADIIIVGVGVSVNAELAEKAGLELENGIKVNAFTQTNDENIYAIGDCSFHHNPHYDRSHRLESVQNAVDQAKVAAKNICGIPTNYESIPWFWSDQFEVKLQMIGLFEGLTESVVRKEADNPLKFSVWHFKGDELLAVDAINNPKAYVIGTKFIKERTLVDKEKLSDPLTELKPKNLILEEVI
ncbi:NAD(P)/FAD-dependent oxidoreductase [Sediminitomix flava]|uniref:3-phenylpropionate/trans-cinnamate dioxygenase ferredoxin reductase subunit n=1 Tax=Sediminitomix flava TaxID=379075 RepID=A0A315ZFD3_SEDFL|nr:FAD/NAD(P)-binding oxidoreductase [Sediminitomix flava]PWJ43883.1 3-phenylpropionate/trans-cinnamate dioxygenase ferredoxin reductase subunit [Sediminitomix flava]